MLGILQNEGEGRKWKDLTNRGQKAEKDEE